MIPVPRSMTESLDTSVTVERETTNSSRDPEMAPELAAHPEYAASSKLESLSFPPPYDNGLSQRCQRPEVRRRLFIIFLPILAVVLMLGAISNYHSVCSSGMRGMRSAFDASGAGT
jgi:hypothetical protein